METDRSECTNEECEYHEGSMCGSCGCGYDEPEIDRCWNRKVRGDPAVWVMRAIRDEVRRARREHPHNRHLFGALVEEVGELANALLEGKSQHEINGEAIQVACVAIRILEERDADYDGWTATDGGHSGDLLT